MNSNAMKLSMHDIYNLPEGQVHSKIAFLKSLLNQESTSNKQFQQHLIKTTYTIKNIGIQGNQIGISSKRLQIKQKQKCQTPINPQAQYYDYKFLPKNLFYSQPLIAVKKQQKSNKAKTFEKLATSLATLGISEPFNKPQQYKSTFFVNQKSLKQLKISKSKQIQRNHDKPNKLLQQSSDKKIKELNKSEQKQKKNIKLRLINNKKSYASLLKDCNYDIQKKNRKFYSTNKLVPLQHSQNPLFKRIVKIKSKIEDIIVNDDDKRKTKSTVFLGRYSIKSRNHFTSTRKLLNSRAKDLD